jgi:hypothetical protein
MEDHMATTERLGTTLFVAALLALPVMIAASALIGG